MKFFLRVVLLLLFISATNLFAQKINLKKNLLLNYEAITPNGVYDFKVKVEEVKKEIIFKFWMTNEQKTSGRIILMDEALKEAFGQYNNFNQKEVALKNLSSIWISQFVYQSLKNDGKVFISTSTDLTNLTELSVKKNENYEVKLDGKKVSIPAMYCETKEEKKYFIYDNSFNPLILHMKLDFELRLKEIWTKS